VFIGTLVGVLPGIGPVGAMSILLPVTIGMDPTSAVVMLAGIFYGAQYGGSRTSILLNIPGEATTVVTCLDGYPMAKQGKAGSALGVSAMAAFIGGTFSVIVLMFLVIPLANAAVTLGPPEYFALICVCMTILIYLSKGSAVKGLIMVILGMILGTIGIDAVSGLPRFAFGYPRLFDGIGIVPVAMGLFGISEVFMDLATPEAGKSELQRIERMFPSREDWKRALPSIGRGSILGFILGVLPGAGLVMATFMSYSVEKRLSKHPEQFGKGAVEGVAGPEASHNAGAGGSFIPLLALGIPSNVIMALLLSSLQANGVNPGPLLMSQHPEIFWGVIASMYVGNCMLLMLNLPLVGLWAKVLKIPSRILMPLVLVCCLIGAYGDSNLSADISIMLIFGVVGYVLRKAQYELAPLILALVLEPILETKLRESLIMSGNSLTIFVTRPISAVILAGVALLLLSAAFRYFRKARNGAPAKISPA
jgi:putative tricarboxylic transport membrane protein